MSQLWNSSSDDLLENTLKDEEPADNSSSELKKRDAIIADLNRRLELLKLHHSGGVLRAAELEKAVAVKDKKIAKLTAENDHLKNNVSRLRDERDTLRLSSKPFKENEEVKNKLMAAERNIAALTTQLRSLQKENHLLEDYVARKQEK